VNEYVLYNDTGISIVDIAAPRTINVRIAETLMVGMACGLASEGYKVYCHAVTPHFLRAWEFVRTMLVPNGYNVILCGAGEGEDYSSLGHTHQMSSNEMRHYCRGAGIPYFIPTNIDELKIVMNHLGPLFIQIPKYAMKEG
jgi:deoxyxylulose-5-phosphate synthase